MTDITGIYFIKMGSTKIRGLVYKEFPRDINEKEKVAMPNKNGFDGLIIALSGMMISDRILTREILESMRRRIDEQGTD